MYYKDIISNPHIIVKYKSRDLVPLKCKYCNIIYTIQKNIIQSSIKSGCLKNYCSQTCRGIDARKQINIFCTYCNKTIKRKLSYIKKVKNSFCSKTCAATFNNTHKSHGFKRSKLEKWLEKELDFIFPKMFISYNNKNIINSELDIFIPCLNIAFVINGIFHYKPIYGSKKLKQIQKNDKKKRILCDQNNINLHIINVSEQSIFDIKSSKIFLDMIIKIIMSECRERGIRTLEAR